MDPADQPAAPRPMRARRTARLTALVAGTLVAVLVLGGCVSVTTPTVTQPPDETPFSGITPPPTRAPETPERDATPEPGGISRPTRRPRVTPTPTAPPAKTPRPTKSPTPAPELTDASADGTPPPSGWPERAHDSKQAKNHVGETGTVCGVVVAAQYLPGRSGRPTFLNIDRPYPDQRFNVVIWGEQRREFPLSKKPEIFMIGKTVCTTGEISAYVDWTQIAYADRAGTDIVP